MDLPLKDPVEFKLFDLGLATGFGLLHLLLHGFFPRKRANLFFRLFAFSAGGAHLNSRLRRYITALLRRVRQHSLAES
ncbi:MAG: hypothetical protein ABI646_11145 [Acidobacteriota bacterium]